ncbi:hypothetical protein C0991_004634, partial [Blastosporella zonata]
MTNLRVFALECSGLSLYKDTQRILESIRNVYNPDLHKVILQGTFTELLGMLARVTLPSLEDLDLTFEHDSFATPEL